MNLKELSKLSVEELRILNHNVVATIKMKNNMTSIINKENLYVGATVIVNHIKLKFQKCIITKINRTKVVINNSYNVPMSMVTLKS
tara:strand:+ start:423 stop:680 length:258 start_codon:yes stop_codon:yes gene_type:complete